MITFYDLPSSGNSYRVRLMLALAGVSFKKISAGGASADEESDAIHAQVAELNGLAEFPVMTDDDLVLRDSNAMLVYIATRYAKEWLPASASGLALIQQWLSVASNEVQNGPRYARAITLGMVPGDAEPFRAKTYRLLKFLDRHLCGREWLELGQTTIADVACFPYVSNAHEGGVETSEFRNIARWLNNVRQLPGYIEFDLSPSVEKERKA